MDGDTTLEGDFGFGRSFTPHMATARFHAGRGWTATEVVAFAELSLSPAAMVFHYGQAIFEGLKAYRQPDGTVALFRPEDHARRFDRSAQRLAMPVLAPGAFTAACEAVVRADGDFVPWQPGNSLYLRPMLIATEAGLGVRAAGEYLFVVMASPVGSYLASGARSVVVWASVDSSRAAPGGTGSAKCAGNYAAGLTAQQLAAAHGCEETLWLDPIEHRWIEELSGMNVVFVQRGPGTPRLVAPPVGATVLDGVTRRSLLNLAGGLGYDTVERPVALDELLGANAFTEAVACGTAAGVVSIGAVHSAAGEVVIGDGRRGPVATRLGAALAAVQEGRAEDPTGWRVPVTDVAQPRHHACPGLGRPSGRTP